MEHIFVPVYQKYVDLTTCKHLQTTIQKFNHAALTCWVSKINTFTMKQKDNLALFLSIIMTAIIFFHLQPDLTSTVSQILHKRAADRFATWTRLTPGTPWGVFSHLVSVSRIFRSCTADTRQRNWKWQQKLSNAVFLNPLLRQTDLQPACGLRRFEVKITTSLQPPCLGSQKPRSQMCRRLLKI